MCSSNCELCNNWFDCTKCATGYYLNISADQQCKMCPNNCELFNNWYSCTKCNTGCELNTDKSGCKKLSTYGRECFETVFGCMKCNEKISTICDLCEFGSTPAEGKCTC